MSPDCNVLILALSHLTFEASITSGRIGSSPKPWYTCTWHVQLGETNAHIGRLYTPINTCTCREEKKICSFLKRSVSCAKPAPFTVSFPAVEKHKLWGVVLRLGPTGVFLSKQVLSVAKCPSKSPLVERHHAAAALSFFRVPLVHEWGNASG